MIPPGRRLGVPTLLCAALLGSGPVRAAAQAVPPPPRRPLDTINVDTTSAADTTPPKVWLPTFPPAGAPGPLPLALRHVFTADSLRFTGALTLADLLARVPGTYVARGGFYGQAEVVFYGGRGAAGVELYWDGVPYLPVGRDSVFLDCGRIPIAGLDRIEVTASADRLRVDLITARITDTEPQTDVVIATGDMDIATYRAGFARRWRSGLGLSVLADHNSLDGDAGTTTGFRQTDVWLKLEYVPRPTIGASYQVLRSSTRRDAGTLVNPWEVARRDGILRAFLASRDDGLGWRVEGTIASSNATGDTAVVTDAIYQSGVQLSHRWPRASTTVTGRLAYRYRPREVEWTGAWLVLPWLNVSASARWQAYPGDRAGSRVAAGAGLRLPLGLSARAEIVSGETLGAPRIDTDRAQRTADWAAAVRWATRWVEIEVARVEQDAYRPTGAPAGLRPVSLLGPTPRTSLLTVRGVLRPLPGLSLSGWYADPVRGGGDFAPPRHARYALTFFSKFWRVYRSGVFALRAEVAAESWSGGLGGVQRDSLGATSQLILSGSTFVDWHLEMQIVGVTLFWQMRNANAMRNGYVPGLPFPTIVQFYGARWTFRN